MNGLVHQATGSSHKSMNISFTNLHQQYTDCKQEIDQAIANTIASSSFITGPDVTAFEKVMSQYVGSEDCASTGSGTTQRAGMNIAVTLGLVAGAFLLVKSFAKK